MSYQYRNNIKSAPESVTSSEQELVHLPIIPPKTSNLTAAHTDQLMPIHSHSQHSYNAIVLPDYDVMSNELKARDENRLEQLTRFCEGYRDWQIRLMLIVIAKYIPIHTARLFDTVLLPYLHSLRHSTLLDTQSVDRNAAIARSLALTPESGRNQLRELNLPKLTLSVNSTDFIQADNQTAKYAKKARRPKTVALVGEFRSELLACRRWVGGCQSLLLIRFLAWLIRRSSTTQLMLMASCLQERLNEKVDVLSLPDTVLTKVFSFLDPISLSVASAVSKSWRELALDPSLWRQHVRAFGEKERLSGLDKAVEMGGEGTVDWRATYKDFYTIRRTMDEGFAQAMRDFCRRGKEKIIRKVAKPTPGHRVDMRHSISPYSALGMKLLSRASLRDLLRVVRDRHGVSRQESIEPEDVQSLLRTVPPSEKERRAQELADRIRSGEGDSQFITPSKEPLLPLIECDESAKTSRPSGSRTVRTNKSTPLPLAKSPASQQLAHKRVLHPSVYRDDLHWRVFDFIQTQSDASTVDPSTMDSRFYLCLSLAGCIPNTQTGNQGPQLPSPLFPLRSVRLFIAAPQQPLFSAACDSKRVLVSSADLRVRLFDSRSGREIGCLGEHKGGVNCIAVTQGLIVTGSWDCTVVVWDSVHFEVRHVIHAHADSVTQVAVDRNVVVSCCKDGEVSVWRRDTWGLVASLTLHRNSVTGLALRNVCTYTASLDGTIGVWRNDSWQLVTVLKIGSAVTCMAVSRGLCVAGCENGYIRLWSLAAFREELSLLNASQELHDQVMASFLGRGGQGGSVRERNCFKQLDVFVMVECTKPSPIRSIAIVNSFLFASNGAAVYQWSLATCSLARIMLGHAAPVTCLAGDRHKLVSVGEDGRVVLWHTRAKPPAVSHQVEPLILFGDIKRIQL